MPVVVLDSCPVSTCRKLWSGAVAFRRSGRAVSVWQQRHVRPAVGIDSLFGALCTGTGPGEVMSTGT